MQKLLYVLGAVVAISYQRGVVFASIWPNTIANAVSNPTCLDAEIIEASIRMLGQPRLG